MAYDLDGKVRAKVDGPRNRRSLALQLVQPDTPGWSRKGRGQKELERMPADQRAQDSTIGILRQTVSDSR
jgi:hypothetical protein